MLQFSASLFTLKSAMCIYVLRLRALFTNFMFYCLLDVHFHVEYILGLPVTCINMPQNLKKNDGVIL